MLTWLRSWFFAPPPFNLFKVLLHNHEVARCTTRDAAEQVVNDIFDEKFAELNGGHGFGTTHGASKSKLRKQFRGSFHIKPIK